MIDSVGVCNMDKTAVFCICLFYVLISWTKAAAITENAEDKIAILRQLQKLRDLIRKHDFETLDTQLYLPESRVMPPDVPSAKGPANIYAMGKDLSHFGMKAENLGNYHLHVCGSMAVLTATFEEEELDGTKKFGRCMIEWKKVNNQWYILYSIWNYHL